MSKEEKNSLNFFAKWSKFFIDKYKITIIFLVALVGVGLYSVTQNQRQDFPTIPVNVVTINVPYIGASPEAVANEVINPIENAIKAHESVEQINSTAMPSMARISVEIDKFDQEAIEKVITDFSSSIDGLTLPEGVEANVSTFDAGGPSIVYVLTSEDVQYNEILEKAPAVKEYLESSSQEIKEVQIIPDSEFKVNVLLDGTALSQSQLNVETVQNIIKGNLSVLPGGSIEDESINTTLQIGIVNPSLDAQEISNISLPNGQKLADIATITRTPSNEEVLTMAGYINGGGQPEFDDEAVYLFVNKRDDGDVIRIENSVTEAVSQIYEEGILEENVKINSIFDTSVYVEDQISSLVQSGLIGLLIIITVFMFFIDWRTGVVVSLIIPLAFLITFFILNQIGFTINILTLFAMILTLGILVDNAIVIAEGILHRLHKYGETTYLAAIRAVRDLGPAVTAATATTIVVFIPFTFLPGVIGEFMKYIPFTIIIMLGVSYILAITITPLLGKWILKKESEEERTNRKLSKLQKMLVIPAIIYYGQKSIDAVVNVYGKFMSKVYTNLALKFAVAGTFLVMLFVSMMGFAPLIPGSQFPITDGSQFVVQAEFPTGTPFSVKRDTMSKLLQEATEVKHFRSAYIFGETLNIIVAEPTERTDDKDTTIFTLIEEYDQQVQYIRDEAPTGTFVLVNNQANGPPASAYDLTVAIKSPDVTTLARVSEELDNFVNNSGYDIKRIKNEVQDSLVPSVRVEFDQDKLNQNGISSFAASQIINSIFSENEIAKTTIREDGVQDEVVIGFIDESKSSIDDLRSLPIQTSAGSTITLDQVALVDQVETSETINFIEGERAVTYEVALEVAEEDRSVQAAEFEQKVKEFLNEDKLNEFGLEADNIAYGGFASDLNSDFSNLSIVFLIAMVAVFLILVFQFDSYLQPILIMMAIPVALIGVFPAVYISGSSLDLISGLGIIALVGIVVNDAIVFIDYYNRQRKKHPDWTLGETLSYVGKVRFKPIFSTSITTIAGILPLTIQDPFWRGLGAALTGGLIMATLGNLVLLPVFIYSVERIKGLFKGSKKKKEEVEVAVS